MKLADESNAATRTENDVSLSTLIYHIADTNQWEQAQVTGFYVHPSLHSEGYIHCSTRDQIEDTANFYFTDTDQIVVLFIDTAKLEAELLYETATRGGNYPHIYGPVNISSVVRSKTFKRRGSKFRVNLPD
jgi:uncharacterized protein (DUF952 family)